MLGLMVEARRARMPELNPTEGARLPASCDGNAARVAAVGGTEMIADPNANPIRTKVMATSVDAKRSRSTLKNTFPAPDPVSVEQPTTTGRAHRS
jgi:hypothetical protein